MRCVDRKHLFLRRDWPGIVLYLCVFLRFIQTQYGGEIKYIISPKLPNQIHKWWDLKNMYWRGVWPRASGPRTMGQCVPGACAETTGRGHPEEAPGPGPRRGPDPRMEPPGPAVVGRGERCGVAGRGELQGKVWKFDTNADVLPPKSPGSLQLKLILNFPPWGLRGAGEPGRSSLSKLTSRNSSSGCRGSRAER